MKLLVKLLRARRYARARQRLEDREWVQWAQSLND